MKKILLSGFTFLALATAVSAQGISDKAVYDDFATVDQYSVITTETKWEDTVNNGQGGPLVGEFAYKGAYWTEADNQDGFSAAKSRAGDGKLDYVVTQPTGSYKPFLVVFGAYAQGTVKKEFTVDISSNDTIAFTFTNEGDSTIKLSVQVQDSAGNVLMFDKAILDDLEQYYNYNLGFVQGTSSPVGPGETVSFAYGLKNAVPGNANGSAPVNVAFNYKKVKNVLFTVVNNNVVDASNDDYRPIALSNYPVSFSSFKLGDVNTIVTGLENNQLFVDEKEEFVTVYDLLGNNIAAGKVKDLNLATGKVYIFKSAKNSRKVVLN